MSTDHDRTQKNRPMAESPANQQKTDDDLLARLAEAFEADAATVQRIKLRARAVARGERPPSARSWAFRWGLGMAVASAFALLVAVGVWRHPATDNPLPTLPLEEPVSVQAEEPAPLVISNESGFVTVQAGGSQWIVLPGDVS